MIGMIEGVICSTTSSTSGGSCDRTALMRFQVSALAQRMSVLGSKSIVSSLAPRIVLARTRVAPMTVLTTCSTGRVTCTSMFGTAKPGTRTTTEMRGKVTSGYTLIGMRVAL